MFEFQQKEIDLIYSKVASYRCSVKKSVLVANKLPEQGV